ncbi:MAG: hypothetical protein DRP06_01745 [Candidatus Aenigmatarchaeota archaeon]|nr:MAG: hypothetical protein DRP06_01745 [Candidatus Aenigmarchaeota archaeon]
MDTGLIGFIVFFAAMVMIIYLKRDKLERHGIVFMMKTTKLRNKIQKNAIKYKKFWNFYFNLGVIVSILTMVFGIGFLISNTLTIASGTSEAGFALVLPGISSEFSYQSGLFLVPIWYWVIAIIILIFPHELSHAVALAMNKLKIKSLGAFIFLFIPGAFVEPDNKQLSKASKWKQLQVFCAGSFSNLVTAVIFILLLNILLVVAYTPQGIYYSYPADKINKTDILEMGNFTDGLAEIKTPSTIYLITSLWWNQQENLTEIYVFEDWPAIRSGLSGTIKGIEGYDISTSEDVSAILSNYKPYDTISIETSEDIYNITLANNNGKAFLGITTGYDPIANILAPMNYRAYVIKDPIFEQVGEFLIILISFVIMVCIGVAIVNLLPMKPLDGGLVTEVLTNAKFTNILSWIIFIMILYNFVGPYLFFI